MDAVALRLERDFPNDNQNAGVNLVSLRSDLVADVRPMVTLLFVAVGLVLLIATANVSGLLVAGGPLSLIAPSRAWALELKTLTSSQGAALMSVARTIAPHDGLEDAAYALIARARATFPGSQAYSSSIIPRVFVIWSDEPT